jgi:hypothetical protein
MHNMLFESERANLAHDDLPYDWEGPLAQVDHEAPAEFETLLQWLREFVINMFINNFRMI